MSAFDMAVARYSQWRTKQREEANEKRREKIAALGNVPCGNPETHYAWEHEQGLTCPLCFSLAQEKTPEQMMLKELRNIDARLARIEDRLRPRASRGKLGPSP